MGYNERGEIENQPQFNYQSPPQFYRSNAAVAFRKFWKSALLYLVGSVIYVNILPFGVVAMVVCGIFLFSVFNLLAAIFYWIKE